MPVQSMLSEFSVGNSTLRPVMDAADAEPAEGIAKPAENRVARKAKVESARPSRAHCLFVLRETSRVRSPHMPYLSILLSHDVTGVPMSMAAKLEALADWLQKSLAASPHLRSLAAGSRANAVRAYDGLVPLALSQFAPLLSEGLDCQRSPPPPAARQSSRRVYSRIAYSGLCDPCRALGATNVRKNRAFCVPIVDMFNFGQVCAWHPLRRLASSLSLVACLLLSLLALFYAFLLRAMCAQVGIRAAFDDGRNAFVATATQPIPAGRELLFYYGSMCHESWINLYGFAPPDAQPCPKPKATATAKGRPARR